MKFKIALSVKVSLEIYLDLVIKKRKKNPVEKKKNSKKKSKLNSLQSKRLLLKVKTSSTPTQLYQNPNLWLKTQTFKNKLNKKTTLVGYKTIIHLLVLLYNPNLKVVVEIVYLLELKAYLNPLIKRIYHYL